MKNNFVLLFVFVLLIGNLFFVLAEETSIVVDIDKALNLEDTEIYGKNIKYQILDNGNLAIYFNEAKSYLVDKDGNIFDEVDFEKDSHIMLNQKGEIISLDLWTRDVENTFIIEKKRIPIPPYSQLIYKNGKVQINAAENSSFLEAPTFSEKFDLEINGNNIKISDSLNLTGSGFLTKYGILLSNGQADFNKMRFSVSDSDNSVLISDSEKSLEGISENYVRFLNRNLEIKSKENGKIDLEVLPGNDFFGTNKREYLIDNYGRYISVDKNPEGDYLVDEKGFCYNLIPDEKDFLKLKVEGGDFLSVNEKIENGEKKIPLINYVASEKGSTLIQNGINNFMLKEKGNLLAGKKQYNTDEKFLQMYLNKYKSVPFELKSNSFPENQILRAGSAQQFEVINIQTGEVIIDYNEHKLDIEKFQNKEIRTIDELKIKYPEIKFDLKEDSLFQGTSEQYTEPTPQLVMVVDKWLEENPDAKIKSLSLGADVGSSVDIFNNIRLSERIIYLPYAKEPYASDRNLGALFTITHEYEHAMDGKIYDSETSQIENLIQIVLINKEHELFKESELIVEEKLKEKDLLCLEKIGIGMDLISLEKRFENQLISEGESPEDKDFIFQVKKRTAEFLGTNTNSLRDMESEYRKVWSNCFDFGKKSLGVEELSLEDYSKINCEPFLIKIMGEEGAENYKKINYALKKEREREKYLTSELYSSENGMLISIYDNLINERKEVLLESEEFKQELDSLCKILDKKKSSVTEKKTIDFLDTFLSSTENNKLDMLVSLNFIAREDEGVEKIYQNLAQLIGEKGGLPATYSLFKTFYGTYDELSSTYREETLEERYSKLNFGTEAQKEVYKKLTQIAFDTGKMGVEEYTNLIGNCKTNDCLDKRCIEYTFLCCQEYPNSPNC